MRRYKGRASTKVMVRVFPHVVEIPAPIGGLGKQIDAMHAFHGQRGTQARLAPRRRDDERDYLRCASQAARLQRHSRLNSLAS
jgi:hypothetical protein